eukprot:15082177-Heterocapsa_arctica.AAC.1
MKPDGGYHEAEEERSTQPWAMMLTGVDEDNVTTDEVSRGHTVSTPTKSLEEAYTIECTRRQ